MSLLGRLALLFILVPVLELALLVRLGQWLGLFPTVGLVVATGVAGALLARAEGVRVLLRFQSELAQGRLPGQAMLDGASVLVGGVLLMTPGIVTDMAGLALLLPPSRRWLQRRALARLRAGMEAGTLRVVSFGPGGAFGGQPFAGGVWGHATEEADGARRAQQGLDPRHEIRVEAPEGRGSEEGRGRS